MVQGGRIFQTNNSTGRNNGTVWKKRLFCIIFTKLVTFCIKKMELNSDEAHIVAKRVGEIKEVLIQLQRSSCVSLSPQKKKKKLKFNNHTVPN